MVENIVNQEGIEKIELKEKVQNIYQNLKLAFGGKSQIPDYVFGQALAGQVNNSYLGMNKNGKVEQETLNQIIEISIATVNEGWGDQEEYFANADEIKRGLNEGLKEAGLDYKV